ncbi:MAG TPA: hypothetical protein VLK65_20195 [Vicinamibacteria bacterium]|nr:hypothetical protein [Vicinamibacteria bacterium]
MRLSRRYGAGACGLVLAAGLASPLAAGQVFGSDPEGLKRTDALIKKAEELVKTAGLARDQVKKTLGTYSGVFAPEVADVRKAYKSVEGEMNKSEKLREQVTKKLDEMKIEA